MTVNLGISTVLLATMPIACSASVSDSSSQTHSEITSVGKASSARDGNIAIVEEFQNAKSKGTIEAMELFIRRHPKHELTTEANTHIKMLMAGGATRNP